LVEQLGVSSNAVQATTAAAQDYTPSQPKVRAVYTPFKGQAPQVVDNAFGFGGKSPIPSSDPAAGGGTAGGGTGTGGGLAHTGNEVTAPLAAAAALIGGGSLIVLAARDRD